MTNPTNIRSTLIELAEPVCADAGYELVDLEYTRGPQGWLVRVYIDHADGGASGGTTPVPTSSIGFDDCERLSRELSALFDVEDPLPHAYSLEVSSPGVDRPLRTAAHFRRYVGETAKIVLTRGQGGRKNFKGRLLAVEEEDGSELVAIDVDGTTFQLPLADVATAKLVPDWDALMKGPRSTGSASTGSTSNGSKPNGAEPNGRGDGEGAPR